MLTIIALINARGFPITKFDTVLRSEPLDNETKRVPAKAVKMSPTAEKAVPKPSQVKTPPALTPTSPNDEGDVESESDKKPIWTDIVRKASHENFINKTSQSKEQTNKFIYLNKEQCRIDNPAEKPSQYNNPAQESYRTKLEHAKAAGKNGFCNRHYLQQYCSYEEKCYADHETKLVKSLPLCASRLDKDHATTIKTARTQPAHLPTIVLLARNNALNSWVAATSAPIHYTLPTSRKGIGK